MVKNHHFKKNRDMKWITHKSVFFCDKEKTDITHITFMESTGKAKARIYLFADDTVNAYMDDLTVTKQHQGKGIGLALQECRENLAKDMGYKTMTLWVKNKTWQKKWYKRRGYEYFKDYENDCVYMRKTLTSLP